MAAVLISIVCVVGFYTFRLSDERNLARRAAEEANQVSEFLISLFTSPDPFVAEGNPKTTQEILEEGREKIDTLEDQPLLQAKLYRVIGISLTGLGLYPKAIELLERAETILENEKSSDPLEIAETLAALGEAQRQNSDYAAAIANRRREVAMREELHGPTHEETARALSRLGATLNSANENIEALAVLERALEIKQLHSTADDEVTLDILGVTAVAYDTLGRYSEAEAAGRRAIALSERIIGPHDPNTVIRMSNLALVLARQWKLEAADEQFNETIERARKIWRPGHPSLRFYMLVRASNLESLGRFDEARALLDQVGDLIRAEEGDASLPYVGYLYSIGRWELRKAHEESAIKALNDAHALAVKLQGGDGYLSVLTSVYLGAAYAASGDYAAAQTLLEGAIKRRSRIGADHGAQAEIELAEVYDALGRKSDADALILSALAKKEMSVGPNSAALVSALTSAAAHFRRTNQLDMALAHAERAATIASATLPSRNWISALADAEYGRTLMATGRRNEARDFLRSAHDDLFAVFGENDERVRDTLVNIRIIDFSRSDAHADAKN